MPTEAVQIISPAAQVQRQTRKFQLSSALTKQREHKIKKNTLPETQLSLAKIALACILWMRIGLSF